MADNSSIDFSKALRSPDMWFGDIQTYTVSGVHPLDHYIDRPGRGVFVYLLKGAFELKLDGVESKPMIFPEGTAFGFESGRPHRWRSIVSNAAGRDVEASLLVSSVPQYMAALRQLDEGMITIGPKVEPFAKMIRLGVEQLVCEYENPDTAGDESVARRAAEICMIQFVRYARAKLTEQPDAPPGLFHDEHLLRAWSAYFAAPRRRWTVGALANAAGLSRSVFAERFNRVFGSPPLQTLTVLRLKQAERMLSDSKAPLIEIAFTVGYNSEAAFIRAFFRQYGVTPGRFRTHLG